MHGKLHQKQDVIDALLRTREIHHDIYVIGSQECMRNIAHAVIAPSKDKWESTLKAQLGEEFPMIASFSLGATHLAVFAHISITPIISNVESECIATGINNTVGNKGAVSVRFNVGRTKVLCICSHLAAGQNGTERRNEDFDKIYKKFVLQVPETTRSEVGCLGIYGSKKQDETSSIVPAKKNMVVALS